MLVRWSHQSVNLYGFGDSQLYVHVHVHLHVSFVAKQHFKNATDIDLVWNCTHLILEIGLGTPMQQYLHTLNMTIS